MKRVLLLFAVSVLLICGVSCSATKTPYGDIKTALFNETSQPSPIILGEGQTFSFRTDLVYAISGFSLNFEETEGEEKFTLSVYKFDTDSETTLSSSKRLIRQEVRITMKNCSADVFFKQLPPGNYLFVIEPSTPLHLYSCALSTSALCERNSENVNYALTAYIWGSSAQ